MLQRPNAIVFLPAWIDACALWRLYMPHLRYTGSSFFCFADKPDFGVIAGNDIVVVQRCCTKPQYDFIKTVQALEMKIVYDLDDNVWELPEYNPAFLSLSAHREGFKHCIRMVDVVSVSTRTLAKSVRQHVGKMINARTQKEIPIVVVENRIEERMFLPPRQDERLIVGWAGSSSHVGDLVLAEEAILHLAAEHPEVMFEFRGCQPPESLQKLENFRHKLWTPVAEYGARMPLWGWSIALAPLTEHPFNSAKSAIKMIEAAYCGIPCLASWVQPYEDFCRYDKELRWLLCAGKSNWEPKLRELVNDPARRMELGRRAQEVAKKHYSYDKPHEGWEEVFRLARAS